jgi:hypothetical protein
MPPVAASQDAPLTRCPATAYPAWGQPASRAVCPAAPASPTSVLPARAPGRTPARRGSSPAPQASAPPGDPPRPPYLHHHGAATPSGRDRANRSTRGLVPGVPPVRRVYRAWFGTAVPGGRAGAGAGVFSRSASARRCSPVSGGAASISSRTQESRSVPGSCAGCPPWFGCSPRRLSAAGLELAGPGRMPGRLAAAVLVSRCGADPLARMN